ncbi:MAG: glycoside hydrolase [Caldithrix sp.]|nr:glycoside hydrolase [Caldithrix sp.]
MESLTNRSFSLNTISLFIKFTYCLNEFLIKENVMVNVLKYLILYTFILLMTACSTGDRELKNSFDKGMEVIQSQYAPDLSTHVFDIQLYKKNDKWMVSGETTEKEGRDAVIAFSDSLIGKNNYEKGIDLLPHKALGDSTYGVIRVSVANLRRDRGHSSELIDQTILGLPVRLLKKKGYWYLVQTTYGYIGWMTRASFTRVDKEGLNDWKKSDRIRVADLDGRLYTRKSKQSVPVCDVVMNNILKLDKRYGLWIKAVLPDGRSGYLLTEKVRPVDEQVDTSVEGIINTAKRLMGVPYLWGGNSTKGNDCSGFTQTVFRANGILLPRDARQQVHEGRLIKHNEEFTNVKAGDLLLFGREDRITHVGISLGGKSFIHQDSFVNIASFDEDAENFSKHRKRTLRVVKRIIN